MQRTSLKLASLMTLALAFGTVACSDDGGGEESDSSETSGDGDGDGDATGDGDGDATGDGDGDAPGDGDGDGDATGDGDGDATGDGDGDATGDGDGDATDSAGDGDGDATDSAGDGDGDATGGELTFAGDVYPIIANSCSCHVAGAPAGLAMSDAETAFSNLVGVPSSQDGGLNRVEAGDPENSYLMQKIRGTAATGGQMPQGGPALPDMTQMVIGDWIAQGANP